jgi:hypothetical protein
MRFIRETQDLTMAFPQACFGAMSFGWDSGVIGGVIAMKPFQESVLFDENTV